MNNKLTSPNLFSDVCGIIEQGRQQAYAAVNKSMIETYWNIGKRIVEEEQSGKERAEYGEEIINTRVRDKKRLVKVGNLVKNSYLYR
ncbi:DUF1016 N-terminal domain-containing protein [Prevotella melaninogenica]|uniref:DUF1016 N-terminal domain-containing protein n=1 Tax=Prevotella melaninogenica TaxID=28132 RepID=UPI001C5D2CF3|nr:DUF1016 N-terminal domain-containing protein [Prevotella melaninogenica]MBW4724484.1 hypothetical protein [Prevotella melaninogenica]